MAYRTVTTECVRREVLRTMEPGDVILFHLPSARQIDSGKSSISQYSHHLQCRFTTSANYKRSTLTVKRI